jgi:hypothetical protein
VSALPSDSLIRQQVIEELMRQIMHYDAEFRHEDATFAVGSREALTAVRVDWSMGTNSTPGPRRKARGVSQSRRLSDVDMSASPPTPDV